MKNDALYFYRKINDFNDIQSQLGQQENIYIDFKQVWPEKGRREELSTNDKKNYSKAASGFAHQEGGIIVWGIEARKNQNGIDEASALFPISNVKKYKQGMEEYVKYATEPILDGVKHKIIYKDDNPSGDKGFLVSYFPKSEKEHRALGGNTDDFYRRHGDSFVPLSTSDIKALFARRVSPNLELKKNSPLLQKEQEQNFSCKITLKNIGAGIARQIAIQFHIPYAGVTWYNGTGNYEFVIGNVHIGGNWGDYIFLGNADFIIYPGQEIAVLSLSFNIPARVKPELKYTIFAENMPPKDGFLN